MRRVILECPCDGRSEEHERYAKDCMSDSLLHGEAPFVPALLYADVLNGDIQGESELGVQAGRAWLRCADALVVYVDYGMTPDMRRAMEAAEMAEVHVDIRSLRSRWSGLPWEEPADRYLNT